MLDIVKELEIDISRNHSSIREQVYQKLRLEILNGTFAPGDRIIEEDICRRYNVSRTPVRESLQKLENEKLLNHVPNKGAIVASWSAEDVYEIFQLRLALEKLVVSILIDKMSTTMKSELEKITTAIESVLNGETEYMLTVESFHPALHRMAKMPRLSAMLKGMSDYLYRVHHLLQINPDRRKEALMDHLNIAKAILTQDKDEAHALIATHLNDGYQFFLSKLDDDSKLASSCIS